MTTERILIYTNIINENEIIIKLPQSTNKLLFYGIFDDNNKIENVEYIFTNYTNSKTLNAILNNNIWSLNNNILPYTDTMQIKIKLKQHENLRYIYGIFNILEYKEMKENAFLPYYKFNNIDYKLELICGIWNFS